MNDEEEKTQNQNEDTAEQEEDSRPEWTAEEILKREG
jgi:hypothetical protein